MIFYIHTHLRWVCICENNYNEIQKGLFIIMKKCLVVVDFQNEFVSGTLGFPGASDLEPYIVRKIKQYRENNDEIIFTFDTHGEDYMDTQEGKNLPVVHCVKDTEGHKLYGQVANLVQKSDKQFCKNTFGSDELYMYLKTQLFESIELVGLVSHICIISNAILAKTAQPETPITVDANCTASYDNELTQKALEVMMTMQIGIRN